MGSLTIDLRRDGEKQQISRMAVSYVWCFAGVFLALIPCLSVNSFKKSLTWETSLVVQELRLCRSSAEGTGSIPGQGIKILLYVSWCGRKKSLTWLCGGVSY